MNKPTQEEFLSVLGPRYDRNFFEDPEGALATELDTKGILMLPGFLSEETLATLKTETSALKQGAYRSASSYNVFVLPNDPALPENSPRNRKFTTTKGCAADDEIPYRSALRKIYDADLFRTFIARLERIPAIFPYGDTLSSINVNYYDVGDSLEWHFDNADFALTLLVQACDKGGVYEYVPEMRYARDGSEDFDTLGSVLDGAIEPKRETVDEGTLMIFRGNRSVHRVSKVEQGERVLVTLNYNTRPGVPLSEESRMTFFGRLK